MDNRRQQDIVVNRFLFIKITLKCVVAVKSSARRTAFRQWRSQALL